VLAVIGGSLLWERARRSYAAFASARAASLFAGLVITTVAVSLAAATISRNREFASGVTLARTIVERRPTGIAHHVLGDQLMAEGRYDEALVHLREAVRQGNSRARHSLALVLFNEGHSDEAIAQLEAFLVTRGQNLVPRWLEPAPSEVMSAHSAMGRAFAMKQQWPQAIEQFKAMLTMNPSSAEAQHLLADALFAQQSFREAIVEYQKYLQLQPDDIAALNAMGIALAATGNLDEAISAFRRTLEVDPQNADAHRNLAAALDQRSRAGG
jgi:protein O-GlcNAc transferase